MKRMAKPTQEERRKRQSLIGSWVNGDEYATEVEYTVSGSVRRFHVNAVDRYDGEKGEVRDVGYESETGTLSFAVYWNSTGRFTRVRLVAIAPNRVSYTYTFTENQMWFRKGTEPGLAVNESRPVRSDTTSTSVAAGSRRRR